MVKMIDADNFAARLNGVLVEFVNRNGMPIKYREGLLARIARAFHDQPGVDAVPVKRGYWMKYEVDVAEHPWHCSCCGWPPPKHVCHIEDMEYCSHCGARMDEKGGEADG